MSSSVKTTYLLSSRLDRLNVLSSAIAKNKSRTDAFNALHLQDRTRILGALNISKFDWTRIEKKGLKGRIKEELQSMTKELRSLTIQSGTKYPISSSYLPIATKHPKPKDGSLQASIPDLMKATASCTKSPLKKEELEKILQVAQKYFPQNRAIRIDRKQNNIARALLVNSKKAFILMTRCRKKGDQLVGKGGFKNVIPFAKNKFINLIDRIV